MDNGKFRVDRISDMAIFARVVERRNFSLAAKDWHMSPSTVSKLVDRLESRLGVRLLDRTSRAVTLTAEGEAFYLKTLDVLAAVQEAQNAVAQQEGDIRGVLRVFSMPTFARLELAKVLPIFLKRYPAVKLELFIGLESPSLTERGLDVMIHSGRLSDSSMIARQISTVRWVICASPEYLSRHGVPTNAADLASHNCLNFVSRDEWNVWHRDRTRSDSLLFPQGNFSSSDGGVLLEMVRAGAGIARLGDFHVRRDIENRCLVPLLLDEHADAEPIFAVYQTRKNLSPRVQAFVDFLNECFEERNSDMEAWWRSLQPCVRP